VESLKDVVTRIERKDARLAKQILASASSISANLAEGSRRKGQDRLHLYRIAAGSAEETGAHLRVAKAWGWVTPSDINRPLAMIDRQLAMLWRLTH
jgi:four helix bundle protein